MEGLQSHFSFRLEGKGTGVGSSVVPRRYALVGKRGAFCSSVLDVCVELS